MTDNFFFEGDTIELDLEGCFSPNLTTNLILKAIIAYIETGKPKLENILELGCGSGAISAFLVANNHFSDVCELSISDISQNAVKKAQSNIANHLGDKSTTKLLSRSGSGLDPWNIEDFDFIINDISAVSDQIAEMSDWFDFAPCDAGEDGLKNTLLIMDHFSNFAKPGCIMIFPLLSLSNVFKFHEIVKEKSYKIEELVSQKWPLPSSMVLEYNDKLNLLNEHEKIKIVPKFGQLIAETTVYKMMA